MPPPQLPRVGKNLYNEGLGKGANSGGRVQQPDSIVCFVCRRAKPASQYSTRQLSKHKGNLYQPLTHGSKPKPRARDHRTTCKTCTPEQTTELTCIVCGETNGLDHFARTQRKNPDTARCKGCIKKQADTAPDLEAPDSDGYASSSDEADEADFDTGAKESVHANSVLRAGDTSYAGSSVNTNTLTSANLNRLERATGSVMAPRPGVPQEADGWVTKARAPQNKLQLQSETMTTMTYDSAPQNRNGAQAPASVSNTFTIDSQAPLRPISAKPAGTETRKGGWARVDKIPKNAKRRGISDSNSEDDQDEDDEDDEEEESVLSGGSAWTERRKDVKTDFDSDPWSRVYK
ncbi:hypothetical protein TWF730_002429 [Orbilia blumenaviensis]|uniref:Stc1 domain-containing protein n=1 Tax=Orbilia blumenaviensis TaxID=1796055 RepID=A0AAV9UED5_9PEZI